MTSKKENMSETRKKIHEEYEASELAELKQRQSRARSIAVGTTTGGVIEIGMRGDFSNLWYLLKPVEAVEIIEQLAAACGLEIAMRPKQNFTAWRSWDSEMPLVSEWKGAAPYNLSVENLEKLGAYTAKQIKAVSEAEEIKKLKESKNEFE